MNATTTAATSRVAGIVFVLGALGEMGVGVLIAVVPEAGRVLIGAPLVDAGLIVARMLGVGVLALGLTWWLSRNDAAAVARCTAGFVLYNFGLGALFGLAAVAAERPALPWLLCVAHLVLGAGFGAATLGREGRRP